MAIPLTERVPDTGQDTCHHYDQFIETDLCALFLPGDDNGRRLFQSLRLASGTERFSHTWSDSRLANGRRLFFGRKLNAKWHEVIARGIGSWVGLVIFRRVGDFSFRAMKEFLPASWPGPTVTGVIVF